MKNFLAETGEMYYDEAHPSTSDGNYEIMDHGDQQRVTVEDYGFAINGIHPVQSSMPVVGNQRVGNSQFKFEYGFQNQHNRKPLNNTHIDGIKLKFDKALIFRHNFVY